MSKEEKTNVKNENVVDFIKLSDLAGKDVKKWSRFPVKLTRKTTRNGINASMQIIINSTNLIIPVVSTEIIGGVTRKLRFYKPERMVSLLLDLGLPQKDERGLDLIEWVFNAPVRFVKGKMQSGDEYHQIEVLFRQYRYESVFLNADQISIIESLAKSGELKDYKGKNIKLVWEERPDVINDLGEDIFEFN